MPGTPYVVEDVMTRTVVALRDAAEFKDIARTMRHRRISALPVLDADGRVVGVVSEADLLPKEESRDRDPAEPRTRHATGRAKARAVTAGELMTSPAVTVSADATLSQAARLMARHRAKRLPVVDGAGVLKGIVSRSDLLEVFLREDQDIAEDIRRGITTHLPAVPVRPIGVEVHDGVVTLTGHVRDTTLVPVLVRLVRATEGVVDVHCELQGPLRRPDLDPDLPAP
ncbi:CBS domain-containing protein [Streptomyces fructofermentans]|uniref:CBS domain-containing protein n=1 Tax=Streptomyces fructofermentans TaxID=152141 RepID=UPI0033EA54FA